LIGKNGSGKSTIAAALEIIQSIGRGINRVGQLVKTKDFTRGRSNIPIRFEVEVLLDQKLYKYVLALKLPENFRELRVFEEKLMVSGSPIYSRKAAQVTLHTSLQNHEAQFLVDWHLAALQI
jgi:ABC-type cobalamin/Fe3+-siderophores transport system ATPase subunit